MPTFEKGQTFLLTKSEKLLKRTKPKYFISLSDADSEDDIVVCFVMNTEHDFRNLSINCNKRVQKFILSPNIFSFLDRPTAIDLALPQGFTLSELLDNNQIRLFEIADDVLCRQIKNCIDWNFIAPKFQRLIKDCF
ncbi:MAG: hypothetical protein GF353_03100 [Candidatus Lokiarchaeota archaeon]|nr:hypothetical protein [Candidatus Lokiarchaeota archaeon]